ncbi:MAG: sigma factor [Candidatus Saccharimonadales bacterium]
MSDLLRDVHNDNPEIKRAGQAEITIRYQEFVEETAKKLFSKLPESTSLDLDDLVQAGLIGLLYAAETYDIRYYARRTFYALRSRRHTLADTRTLPKHG